MEESRAKMCDNTCIFACPPVVGEGGYWEFVVKHSRVLNIGVFPQGCAYTGVPKNLVIRPPIFATWGWDDWCITNWTL